jgi:hypothetical protein
MNIEGAEVDALNGFEQAVRRTRHVCIGCHDFLAEDGRGGDELRTRADVEAFLKASGFVVFSQPHELPWIADYLYGSSTPRGMPGEEEAQTETLSA